MLVVEPTGQCVAGSGRNGDEAVAAIQKHSLGAQPLTLVPFGGEDCASRDV